MQAVCIYCGSRHGDNPAYTDLARATGRAIAEAGLTLIYGGGNVGLMGETANAALAAGGKVIGIIPQHLLDKEVGHVELSELIVVPDMHQRKLKMATLADAFIALPGGIGTLEELFETWTWRQLGLHHKPLALLDCDGFYSKLVAFLDEMTAHGFIRADQRPLLHCGDDPHAVLRYLAEHAPTYNAWDHERA